MIDSWRRYYEQHLRSPYWQNLKAKVIQMRGYECERCGLTSGLDLHHKNYDRLGRERVEDVELVCRENCHPEADDERKTMIIIKQPKPMTTWPKININHQGGRAKEKLEGWRVRPDVYERWVTFVTQKKPIPRNDVLSDALEHYMNNDPHS